MKNIFKRLGVVLVAPLAFILCLVILSLIYGLAFIFELPYYILTGKDLLHKLEHEL